MQKEPDIQPIHQDGYDINGVLIKYDEIFMHITQ